jgi:hypothetical protein
VFVEKRTEEGEKGFVFILVERGLRGKAMLFPGLWRNVQFYARHYAGPY